MWAASFVASRGLHVERDTVPLGDFEDLWHVGGGQVRAELFEVVLKAGGRDEEAELAGGRAGVAVRMDESARGEDGLTLDDGVPLALHQYLEVAFEYDEGLVFLAMLVRWWTATRGIGEQDDGRGTAGHAAVDENLDCFSEDCEGLYRGHGCSRSNCRQWGPNSRDHRSKHGEIISEFNQGVSLEARRMDRSHCLGLFGLLFLLGRGLDFVVQVGRAAGDGFFALRTGNILGAFAAAVGLWLHGTLLLLQIVRRLGGMMLHGDLFLLGQLAGHLLKLFDAGKLVDVLQAEAEEEILGRLVEDGAADDLFAARRGDELAGHQRAEDAARVDAADLGDLGGGDGLLVGDDSEGLERLQGELQRRLQGLDEAADGVVVLGLGREAVAASDLADLEAAVAGGVVGDELVEDGAEVLAQAAGLLLVLFGLAGGLLVGWLLWRSCASLLCLGGGSFRFGIEGVARSHRRGVRDGVLVNGPGVGGI